MPNFFLNTKTPKSLTGRSTARGVTLVELMIGLVLGLIVIGGFITVFLANQRSAQIKADLDAMQETTRYVEFTLGRVIRQSSSVFFSTATDYETITSSEERLTLNHPAGANLKGCDGNPVDSAQIDTFELANGVLRCISRILAEPETSSSVTILGEGIHGLSFRYGIPAGGLLTESVFYPNTAVTNIPLNLGRVVAVRVEMLYGPDPTTPRRHTFVTTLRPSMISEYGTPP